MGRGDLEFGSCVGGKELFLVYGCVPGAWVTPAVPPQEVLNKYLAV